MLWRPLLASVLCLLCVAPPAVAQHGKQPRAVPMSPVDRGPYVHQSWTAEQGLPVNAVIALAQDAVGYIWMGTYDGLVRFDGVRFTVFNSANTPALPSNRIVALRATPDSSLWMQTESGQLVRLKHGVVTHFDSSRGIRSKVTEWHVDQRGKLWVGLGNGLGVVEGERLSMRVPLPGSDSILSIASSANGVVYAGTMGGSIFRVDRTGTHSVPWRRRLGALYVQHLQLQNDSLKWVASRSIWRYGQDTMPRFDLDDPQTAIVEPRTGMVWTLGWRYAHRIVSADSVEQVTRRTDVPFTRDGLIADDSGYVVYASGATLLRSGRPFASILPKDRSTAGPYIITALIQDREGSYWVGTQASGLHRLKPSTWRGYSEAEGMGQRIVNSVYQDSRGTIWAAADHVNRMIGERFTVVDTFAKMPLGVNTFTETRDGTFWVGGSTGHGVRKCTPGGDRCARVAELRGIAVFAMHQDRAGTLWVGGDTHLHRFDGSTWRTLNDDPTAPSSPVRAFAETKDGAVWMSTAGGGIVRYAGGTFRHITTTDGLPTNYVRGQYVDRDGYLWVGTEGHGLLRLDPREWRRPQSRGRIVQLDVRHGLFDNSVHGVIEDDHGRFWMGTNRGVFWVMRRELIDVAENRATLVHAVSYTERDGMRNRETNGGMQPSAIKTRDGRLWFATQDGVAVVDPRRLGGSAPTVVVEKVVANDGSLNAETGPVELPTGQRTLEVQYTALSLRSPENIRFRYRLEPYDTAWVEANTRRSAFYTKVPPGRYTFRVAASNNGADWQEAATPLRVTLPPRLWETIPARIAAFIALVAALLAAVRWRTRRLQRTAQELTTIVDERTRELREQQRLLVEQAEQLRELDEVKSRFFANVSHEFRTPLTLTIGPLEDLQEDLHDNEKAAHHAAVALRNARRLLRLVNQIMDVAKLEAGQMRLQLQAHDLAGFSHGIASAFTSLAHRTAVRLDVVATGPVEVPFDEDAMEKILANLLANAFKFTPHGGHIEITVDAVARDGANMARLSVSDSGPGIAPEQLPYIFDRFHQVDESNTRQQPGTGIGLALTKELVELHGGTISVCSSGRDGVGARFTVLLPGAAPHGQGTDASRQGTIRQEVPSPELLLATAASAPVEITTAMRDDGDRTTVLVIDDNAELRAYVRAHLEPLYRVLEAGDGEAGLQMARASLPDLIVSDVMMPGMDGTTLCRALRADPETDFLPVILLTARAESESRITGFEAGADDYLAKPFEKRELLVRVENLLASRRRLRERFSAPRQASGPIAVPTPAPSVSVQPSSSPSASPSASPSPVQPEREPADRRFVELLESVVDLELADPAFSVAALADRLAVDRTYLFRRTRELLGVAPSDLIRTRRLERAATLLATSTETVAEVAYGTGFNSVSYFCRCFRDAHGITPTQYRERVPT